MAGAELNAPAILLARMIMPLYVPPAVGVPAKSPVTAFSVKPGGSVPDCTEYVGAGKPFAVKMYEYVSPNAPDGGICAENADGAMLIWILKGAVSNVPAILVARTTIGPMMPETVGVPESTPPALKVKPIGSVPDCTEYVGAGKPSATKV